MTAPVLDGIGVLDRLGWGWEVLPARRPALVLASGRPPAAEGLRGTDLTVQAISGVLSSTGFSDGPPVQAGAAVVDVAAGSHLAAADLRVDDVDVAVAACTAGLDGATALGLLQQAGIPAAPVRTLRQVLTDPVLRDRGMLAETGEGARRPTVSGSPLHLPDPPVTLSGPARPRARRGRRSRAARPAAPGRGRHRPVAPRRRRLTAVPLDRSSADTVRRTVLDDDHRDLATSVDRWLDGDVYRVSGSTTSMTNGSDADLVGTVVRTGTAAAHVDLGLLVVATGAEGRTLDERGMQAQDTGEVLVDDAVVPVVNRPEEEGPGLRYLTRALAQERLSIALGSV